MKASSLEIESMRDLSTFSLTASIPFLFCLLFWINHSSKVIDFKQLTNHF